MRAATIRVNASKVQGEGAFVFWKRLTWAERREAREQIAGLEGEDYRDYLLEFILAHITGWNWTGVDGLPLPLPTTIEELTGLYIEELDFLCDVTVRGILGKLELTPETAKN